ncbi:hypothetical protein AOQ84DRAFT_321711 [Glonium stellatum]|uniref:Uncharacterized protein n=1 Tax=Glonium stellatum TaxID=574774 RepID=A0A8E2JQW6_9PEZI|nr:hypothetical protein AOQ84DRAFT_321711 [Glonium stellatum]
MYRRNDPRFTRTLQNVVHNIESANESAQANLFTFAHDYINPCISSIGNCFQSCIAPCFPSREDRLRRNRGRSRGRAELSFDFYDDWEDEENDGLLGLGNDELDRLLAGSRSYGGSTQPSRQQTMSYGTRRDREGRFPSGRRKSAVQPHDGGLDPTIIPSSSYFGFLGRLPWKIGGKGLRYKPSAADLTEHPGASRRADLEEQPLIEDSGEEEVRGGRRKGQKRNRSHTTGSGHTTDSLSSRGDIFPSEDEDDAVPLDDEFTMVLERRATGQGADDTSSGKTRSGKRSAGSRMSARTASSRSTHESGRKSRGDSQAKRSESAIEAVPTLSDLKHEEERVQQEEEAEVERKRYEARQLAMKRGLSAGQPASPTAESKIEPPVPSSPLSLPQIISINPLTSPLPSPPIAEASPTTETVPFPTFDPQTAPESGAFDVDGSELGSASHTPNRPLSVRSGQIESDSMPAPASTFVPARLPHFEGGPD